MRRLPLLPADVQDDRQDVPAGGQADDLGRDWPIRADDRGDAALLHRYRSRPTPSLRRS